MFLRPYSRQYFVNTVFGVALLLPAVAFAQHGTEATRCEVVLTKISSAAAGPDEQSELTAKALAQLRRFLNSTLDIEAEPKNSTVTASSESSERAKAQLAARLSAVLEDQKSKSAHSHVIANIIEGAEHIQTELLSRQGALRGGGNAAAEESLRHHELSLIEALNLTAEGHWLFLSSDFKTSAAVGRHLIQFNQWPKNSEQDVQVVSGARGLIGLFAKIAEAITFEPTRKENNEAWVRLDSLLTFNKYTGQPVLIEVVRFHEQTQRYDIDGPRGGHRDTDEELSLEEQAAILEKQGLVPIRVDARSRRPRP